MPRCSVLLCKNDSRTVNVTNGGVSYHRFPKNPHVKEKWIDATGRVNWFPKASNTICSSHFDPKDILLTKKGYKYISDTAVPTRNFLSYHARTPAAEAKSKSKSDEVEVELPLARIKVEATPGPSRKRAADSSTESPFKSQKASDSDSDYSDDEDYQNLSEKEKELDSMLRYEQNKIKKQNIKMQRLQKKLKRLKKSILDMEDLFTILDEKFNIPGEDLMALRNIDVQVSELTVRRQTNKELSEVISKLTYSEEFRSFALTLRFISTKAYDYIRKMFKTSLPHPRTLKHWYLNVGGEPGFTKEAFVALKRKAEAADQLILATLVIDDMDVTRRVEIDGKEYGYIDIGTGLEGDNLNEAREVIALSVAAIHGNFNVPVAYFLTYNVTSEQRAELVKLAIEMAHDAGIKIVALSVDNNMANVHMANRLGCNFETGLVTFNHPVTEEHVVVVLDPSNLIKSLQTTLRDFGTLIDKDGNEIQWKFFKEMNKVTYLSKNHKHYIDFYNKRVAAKQATEFFSPRVAEALQYCRQDLELESFKDSEATQMFVTMCNTIYDVFYSSNSHVYGFKNALDKNNVDQIFEFLNMASEYINNLKVREGFPAIRCHKNSMCFVAGVKQLYLSLVKTDYLEKLPLYKLSNDPLKLFFWNIKVDTGCKIDKDPTPKKVILAYKKLVAKIKRNKSKNPPLEQISIPLSPSPIDRINRVAVYGLIKEDNREDAPDLENALDLLSSNNEEAVVQIAVYIVRELILKVNCDVCVDALVNKKRSMNNYIVAINKARLLYLSIDVVKVCKTTEIFLKGFDKESKQQIKSEIIQAKIMRQFVDSKIFDDISYHQVGEFPESNHVTDLMKAIVEKYAQIHFLLRTRRGAYKNVIAKLKEKWMQPLTTQRHYNYRCSF